MERNDLEKMRKALEMSLANHPFMRDESKHHILIMKLLNLCESELEDELGAD